MRRRGLPSALAVVAAGLIVVGIGYAFTSLRDDPNTSEAESASLPLIPGDAVAVDAAGTISVAPPPLPGELDRVIGELEQRVAENFDGTSAQFLGTLYLRRAGLSLALADYERAVELLEQVVEMDPADLDAIAALAAASLGVHDFVGASALAGKVLVAESQRLDALATLGDARLALGDFDGADTAFAEIDDAVPAHPAILARQAALAYVSGDTESALSLAAGAESRATEAGAIGQSLAWFRAFRADLDFDLGRYADAQSRFQAAADNAPGFATATIGLAETAAAQGDLQGAIELIEGIAAPGPDDLFLLGDLRTAVGDEDMAADAYAAGEALALSTESDAYLRILVTHYADRSINLEEAIRLAELELETRKDPFGWDAYAWALYRSGRFRDAREAADAALAFETEDAGLWYHAGLISAALGENGRAAGELERALAISPQWHPLFADDARARLDAYSG